MNRNSLISRMEKRFGRFAVQNLMAVVVGTMALVFVLDYIFAARIETTLSEHLAFDREAVLSGEIWRVLTFAFLPPDSSVVFIIFSLYFYWLIGSTLEGEWGAFRFNLFYLCGIIGTVICGFIMGYATNFYLNMSLFFAFALMYPDFELYLFFVIPVKIKYLAFADLLLYIHALIWLPWSFKVAALAALANIALFFFDDISMNIKRLKRNHEMKKRFRR